MARARNIKPGFFTSEQVVSVAYEWRLLFAGLWLLADRKGRLQDRPKTIKMAIFPGDELDVNSGLNALHDAKLIVRYVVDGVGYIEIPEFLKHQNPHIKEPASTCPNPPEHSVTTVQTQCCNSANPAESGILNPESGIQRKPKAGKPPCFDPLSIELPASIPADAWASWVEYRMATRKKLTEQTWRAQVVKLDAWYRLGHDPTAIINESIANGWQGLFEPKVRMNGHGNSRSDRLDYVAAELTGRNRPDARIIDGQAIASGGAPVLALTGDVWPAIPDDVGAH